MTGYDMKVLDELLLSEGWTRLLVPKATEAMEAAVMGLLYKEDNEATDLAYTKGLINGIRLVIEHLPADMRLENSST